MRSLLAALLLIASLIAMFALARGRLRWARIASRKMAGLWVVGLMIAVGVVAPPEDAATQSVNATPSPSSTASPNPSSASEPPAPSQAPDPDALSASPSATLTANADNGVTSPDTAGVQTAAADGTALSALAQLTIKGRAPKTGYTRDAFGQAWYDLDRNGCDTRNDILRRDLVNRVIKTGTNGCKVLEGDAKPGKYTGALIHFVYGGTSEIDIDHVVALGDAWQKGAQQLTSDQRRELANDPLNLLAVSASANRQKGDGDAATWLPSNKSFRCPYVARQVAVKTKYSLWGTAAEHDAIARILNACPTQPLPTGGNVPLDHTSATSTGTTSSGSTGATATASPAPKPPAASPPPTSAPKPAAKSYPNCDAMHIDYPHGVGRSGASDKTSGKPVTNFTVNESVYNANTARDRDKDGIACEKA